MIPEGYRLYVKEKIDEYIKENNRLPQKQDLKGVAIEPFIFEYGSWKYALISLGYLNNETYESTLEELKNLHKILGGFPTLKDAKEHGINIRLLTNKHGSWSAVKEYLKTLDLPKAKRKINKEIELDKKVKVQEEKLIKLWKENGNIPSAYLARQHNISVNCLLTKYGKWNKVKEVLRDKYGNEIK